MKSLKRFEITLPGSIVWWFLDQKPSPAGKGNVYGFLSKSDSTYFAPPDPDIGMIYIGEDKLTIVANVHSSNLDEQPYCKLEIEVNAQGITYNHSLTWYAEQTSEEVALQYQIGGPGENMASLTWAMGKSNTGTVQWELRRLRDRNKTLAKLIESKTLYGTRLIEDQLRLVNQALTNIPQSRLAHAGIQLPVTDVINNEALRRIGAFERVEAETFVNYFSVTYDGTAWQLNYRTENSFEQLPPLAKKLFSEVLQTFPVQALNATHYAAKSIVLPENQVTKELGAYQIPMAYLHLETYRQIVWKYHPFLLELKNELGEKNLLDVFTPT